MKRRGNKSHKVPNVKLRPVADSTTTTKSRAQRESSILVQDSQLGSDDTAVVDLCPRPFKGIVVCATGMVDKPTLFKMAVELGAAATTALTDRVTHLVAADHGGAKYLCALERKLPILTPEWITESYQIWLRGDDVDLQESIHAHRLPIFAGTVICLSGITEVDIRSEIHKLIAKHGGTFVKNLERPVKVTHLLCSGDEETDKMKYAERFNERGEANVHLVWEEWFWDSLEFGGRFNEEKYQVRRPRPQTRKSILLTASQSASMPSSVPQESGSTETLPTQPPANNDTDTNGNAPADEELAVKRLPATTLQVWGSLLSHRGYEISNGRLVRSPSKARPPAVFTPVRDPEEEDDENEEEDDDKGGNKKKKSVLAKFTRSHSFAPVTVNGTEGREGAQPFRKVVKAATTGDVLQKVGESSTSAVQLEAATGTMSANIFGGATFLILGEAKNAAVRAAIEEHGGRLGAAEDMDEAGVDYVLVRLVSGSKLYREEPDEMIKRKYRTECWLERCIFEERVCALDEHVTFKPLGIQVPLIGAEKLIVSYSGLDQSDVCFVSRLLRALGIPIAQSFSRRTTHLLCPSLTGPKFDKAKEWNIPVVGMEFLNAIVESGTIPLRPINDLAEGNLDSIPGNGTSGEVIDPKGKRRAVDHHFLENGKEKMVAEPMVNESFEAGPPHDNRLMTMDSGITHEPTIAVIEQPHSLSSMHSELNVFGRPMGALGGRHVEASGKSLHSELTITTPARSRTLARPVLGRATAAGSAGGGDSFVTTPTRTGSAVPGLSPHQNAPLTRAEIERERKQTMIPSSKTPSPMKMPPKKGKTKGKGKGKAVLRREATVITSPSEKATRALQESIETLLGKRDEPDEREGDQLGSGRGGKRARGRPSRTMSRHSSHAELEPLPAPVFIGDSVDGLEGFGDFGGMVPSVMDEVREERGDVIRITYEDPGQREERKKLMGLVKGGVNGKGKEKEKNEGNMDDSNMINAQGKKRRSLRVAGF